LIDARHIVNRCVAGISPEKPVLPAAGRILVDPAELAGAIPPLCGARCLLRGRIDCFPLVSGKRRPTAAMNAWRRNAPERGCAIMDRTNRPAGGRLATSNPEGM
jgi:hypothetical protein